MHEVWGTAALWIGLALVATLLSIWFREIDAGERNMEIKTEVIVGHPADQIVRYAKEKNSDMIVIGQKGKSKIENWLLGSVSKRAATYAPCTVTIVK
jgi:nucleotide-binding universal stress UspA family protein